MLTAVGLRFQYGVSLIELMVSLAVFAILVAVGLPSYNVWIENAKIRTVAESFLNGMQLTRAEAVRRNTTVQFAKTTGAGWTVSAGGTEIQTRPAQEGSTNVDIRMTPLTATRITFNGLGRVVANADASSSITQVEVDSATLPAAKSRELRITVSTGGETRMCDPEKPATDPRAC